MDLSLTAYVILGWLDERARSGYDIKQVADLSTRHFSAISYGQIYPELKRLTEAGLVEPEDSPTGARQRTVYRLTEPGRRALSEWVSDPTIDACELRDQMLLRLFFSDATGTPEKLGLLRAMRARHQEVAASLGSIEPMVSALAQENGHPMHHEVLNFGIGLHSWCADWCTQLEARLTQGESR
jgi:DNA-binding PadR family transcriptional regulator